MLITEFVDETDFFQYGQESVTELISMNDEKRPAPSSWNDHPSRNSTGLYKFTSLEIDLDQRVL